LNRHHHIVIGYGDYNVMILGYGGNAGNMQYLLFHSKAAMLKNNPYGLPPDAGRILSNFAPIAIQWRGNVYPTVEHAFQGAKYLYASNHPEVEADFRQGGSIGPDPVAAKKAGGRSGMRERNTILDIEKWNVISTNIMIELIHIKAKVSVVRDILRICHKNNIQLYHFSRTDMKWGCHVNADGTIKKGENLLGEIFKNYIPSYTVRHLK